MTDRCHQKQENNVYSANNDEKRRKTIFALLTDLSHTRKTIKGWQHISYKDENVSKQNLESLSQISSLKIIHVGSIIFVAWQCVIAYITSPKDLRNLAATCRLLNKLVESELGWSYLIRTKFGNTIWLRHVRQIFNQQIDLHDDIESMESDELSNKCIYLPESFLHNRAEYYGKSIIRAILCSYRYYLEKEIFNHTAHIIYLKLFFVGVFHSITYTLNI